MVLFWAPLIFSFVFLGSNQNNFSHLLMIFRSTFLKMVFPIPLLSLTITTNGVPHGFILFPQKYIFISLYF